VGRHRDLAAASLGALLIVVAAGRTPGAQGAPLGGTAAPGPQPSSPQTTTRSAPVGFFNEPDIITRNIDYFNERWGEGSGRPKNGFYPEFSNMITGAGWVSAGPGFRHYFSDARMMLDTPAAISWHLYKMGQARFELPTLANDHLIVGAQAMWQDAKQGNYYGRGADSREENQSQYRLQSTDFVGDVTVTPNYWLSISGELGWLMQPKVKSAG